jgi:hypothetical protein
MPESPLLQRGDHPSFDSAVARLWKAQEVINVQVCHLLNFPDGNARGSVSQIRQFAAINGIVVEGEENIAGLPVQISGSRNNLLRSAFTVHNLGIDIVHLPTIYLVSGLFSIFMGPLVGKASDAFERSDCASGKPR